MGEEVVCEASSVERFETPFDGPRPRVEGKEGFELVLRGLRLAWSRVLAGLGDAAG